MNLKKQKDTPKGVDRLYKELDKIVVVDSKDNSLDNAEKVTKYVEDLSLLVEDGLSSIQDIVQTVDEVVDHSVIDDISYELSEAMDWPESLDDTIWEYIKSTNEEELEKAFKVVINSNALSHEDKVIVVDEIIQAYE